MRVPTLVAVALTLAATLIIAGAARVAYEHTEERLTSQQTRLTGVLLQTAVAEIEAQLNRVAGLSAESQDPPSTFKEVMTPLMKPHGQFSSAALVLVGSSPQQLIHLGSAPLRNPQSAAVAQLYERAARSPSVVTTRATSRHMQKLGYLVSAKGPAGVYVVGVSQQLPASRHVNVPASSPDSSLDFALYYGKHQSAASLIETSASKLPIAGNPSVVTVPFGSSHLTLVAAPRTSLAGAWSEYLPWGIVILGILLTLVVGTLVESLARRRRAAESSAGAAQALYNQQREVSQALQSALLPKLLPSVGGVDIAASYIPTTIGAEVGGDWYSVIGVDDDRFAFVVGDVSGHGLSAASAMAPLRFSIRTLARLGTSPSEILRMADSEIDVVRDDHFATVLVGVVDLTNRTVTLASGGHPLPLLVTDRGCEQLDMPIGTPLGLGEQQFPEHSFPLPSGATLLAFTDGLVERRGDAIVDGIARLKQRVTPTRGESADFTLQGAIAEVVGRENEDDIAVLVIRFLAAPSQHDVPRSLETTGAAG